MCTSYRRQEVVYRYNEQFDHPDCSYSSYLAKIFGKIQFDSFINYTILRYRRVCKSGFHVRLALELRNDRSRGNSQSFCCGMYKSFQKNAILSLSGEHVAK